MATNRMSFSFKNWMIFCAGSPFLNSQLAKIPVAANSFQILISFGGHLKWEWSHNTCFFIGSTFALHTQKWRAFLLPESPLVQKKSFFFVLESPPRGEGLSSAVIAYLKRVFCSIMKL